MFIPSLGMKKERGDVKNERLVQKEMGCLRDDIEIVETFGGAYNKRKNSNF
jgi:hypothetical protein